MPGLKQHIRIAKKNTRITPRLHAWLNNHDGIKTGNPKVLLKVVEILAPSEHDRSGVFHPSQLYQCKRAQVFDFAGLDAQRSYNPTLQNLFNDGHFRHLRWQIMLLEAGLLTDIEIPISLSDKRLGGSIDGVNSNEGWLFELKGTSQFGAITAKGPMPEHIKQVHAYMLASGYDLALIVYEDKISQQWSEHEVRRDPKIIGEIEAILGELNEAIDHGVMPEVYDDCANQTGARWSNCRHRDTCAKVKHYEDITPLLPPQRRSADTFRHASGD